MPAGARPRRHPRHGSLQASCTAVARLGPKGKPAPQTAWLARRRPGAARPCGGRM